MKSDKYLKTKKFKCFTSQSLILGQSAAVAANLAIKNKVAIQDVFYEDLKTELEKRNQILTFNQ